MSKDLIADIYNSFNPFDPLYPGDPKYVDCSKVRGDEDIFSEIGKKIIRSDRYTYQLYTGHRGVGKSTELLRLKQYLENNGCFVVYFGATEDIDEQDVQYTDIILAITRNILEQLKNYANVSPLLNWLEDRWDKLKDLAISEIDFKDLKVESQISLFAKLTASVRRIPSKREEIRKQVDLYSESLVEALNTFIRDASQQLHNNLSRLVVIADNLDRIVPLFRDTGRTNHDEIFLDYHTQLTRLNCHIIYTVPISLVYSNRASELRSLYGSPETLPMIMVKDKNSQFYQKGLKTMTEIIYKRIFDYYQQLEINRFDLGIFDKEESRIKLCLMTGGHVRELMLLMQTAINYIDNFPITKKAVSRAINKARESTYSHSPDQPEWEKLAIVSRDKCIPNDENYRSLLFRRCVLEYREINETGEIKAWYDVHPLIEELEEFKKAKENLG